LEGLDAVVHLAGENVAGRWTRAKKARIRDSRVRGTRLLAEALARSRRPPKVLACASAVAYYGDRGEEVLRESSPPGRGFLAEVCRAWESATAPAAERGIRVVNLRFGLVLSRAGGALGRMLPVFRVGLGGRLGDGRQYWSWVALDDCVAAIGHALASQGLAGGVNVVAPHPVTNAELTAALGGVLSRPAPLAVPAFAARLAFGEMAREVLLASARVEPARLLAGGFRFRFGRVRPALEHVLGGRH
jgi:uncharacterized protein (TIGR01777 family)